MGLQATIVREILQTAASRGPGYGALCRMADVTEEEVSNSETFVDWERAALIWNPLLEVSGDDLIGLQLGAEVHLSMNGMVGFLMQSSEDLAQAIQVFCRYSAMVAPMVEFSCVKKGDAVHFEMRNNKLWQATYPETARQAMDFTISAYVRYLRLLSGKQVTPLRIVTEASRRRPEVYRQVLGCEVIFNADIDEVVVRAEDMKLPVVRADKTLFETFNTILAQREAVMVSGRCSERLKQRLFMQFKGQIPSIEEAAESLSTTPRTLQRKLTEEGTSFREVAGDVRKEVALQLMRNPSAKLSDVSDVLGYSDPTAFRRAFKGWTCETPKAVKRKLSMQSAD